MVPTAVIAVLTALCVSQRVSIYSAFVYLSTHRDTPDLHARSSSSTIRTTTLELRARHAGEVESSPGHLERYAKKKMRTRFLRSRA